MNTSRGMGALKAQISGQPAKEENRYEFFRSKLETSRNDLKAFLGTNAAVDRFVNICVSAVVERPELLEADMRTLLIACKKAANDGLKPDGREAVLNIYNSRVKVKGGDDKWVAMVQYLPMVAGIVKQMYRGGATYVDAAAVYEKDFFEFRRGDETRLVHEPTPDDNPGSIIAAYAVVRTSESAEPKREVMWARDLAAVRRMSKQADSGPWVKWPDQMSIKSVLHRIRKQLSLDDEKLDHLLEVDNVAMGYAQGGTSISALDFSPTQTANFDVTDTKEKVAVDQDNSEDPNPNAAKTNDDDPVAMTFAQVAANIKAANSTETLQLAADLISSVPDEKQRDELHKLVAHKLKELTSQPKGKS